MTGIGVHRLVFAGVEAGVIDSYGFAEWLVTERKHFGDPLQMPDEEIESAWLQAEEWWRATKEEVQAARPAPGRLRGPQGAPSPAQEEIGG